MKEMSIRLPDDIFKHIKDEAKEESRSLNSLFNMIVKRHVNDRKSILAGKTQIDIKGLHND